MDAQGESISVNTIEFAGMLGRIEANLENVARLTRDNSEHMRAIDERLRVVETAVANKPDDQRFTALEQKVAIIESAKRDKLSWPTILSGLASGIAVIGFVTYLLVMYINQ